MDYDPTPVFARIRCPLLVVVPAHDMQVPPEDGEAIRGLVTGPCDKVIVRGVSHILRDDPDSKGPRAYRRAVKLPVSPALLAAITAWVAEQLADPSPLGAEEVQRP
jgi:uncharacterized protein